MSSVRRPAGRSAWRSRHRSWTERVCPRSRSSAATGRSPEATTTATTATATTRAAAATATEAAAAPATEATAILHTLEDPVDCFGRNAGSFEHLALFIGAGAGE